MLRIFKFNVHTIEKERDREWKEYIITNSARNDSMRAEHINHIQNLMAYPSSFFMPGCR